MHQMQNNWWQGHLSVSLLKEGANLSSKDSGSKADFYELGKKDRINFMLVFMQ